MEIIKLNLIPSGVNPICHAKQYDEGRIIRFMLFDGLTPYTLQSGDTVTLNLRKPDNTIIESSVTATQGNKYVDLVTTEQICAVAGYNLGTFKITNGSVEIGTLNFIMEVGKDVLANGIPSQSVIEDLDALVAEAVADDLGDNYYTKTETDNKISALIDDTTTANNKVWSSDKTYKEILSVLPNRTASGTVATFNTKLALPLVSAKFGIEATLDGYSNIIVTQADGNMNVINETTIPLGSTIYGGEVIKDNSGTRLSSNYDTVDLGTLNWTYDNTYHRFSANPALNQKAAPNNNTKGNIICSNYITVTDNQTASSSYDKSVGISSAGVFHIRDVDYTDAQTFKTALNGVMLVFEIRTPNIITLSNIDDIITLIGTNNIFVNSGNTEVIYKQSTTETATAIELFKKSDILYGKTLVCCGDSITFGQDMDSEGITNQSDITVYQCDSSGNFTKVTTQFKKTWGYQIAERNNMTFYNGGVSGSTMQGLSARNGFSLANGRYTKLPDNIDYLVIWFGWNDEAYGTLGTIEDNTNETFYGGFNVVMPYLINKYPYTKIALIVPYGSNQNFRNAVRQLGDKWGVAVWDNYQGGTPLYYGKEASINVEPSIITSNRAKFQVDGIHPNYKGHIQLGDMIEQFLRGI